MITITSPALVKIKDILAEENTSEMRVRVFVQGGGCSGFQYGFTMDAEKNEDDFVVENTEDLVVVDAMSMQYLQGARINYKDDLNGSSFVIDNPGATSTCGCGSSFSV
jgi:iron-sulfur cluster insertion protein